MPVGLYQKLYVTKASASLDAFYGPYTSMEDAMQIIHPDYRAVGKQFALINSNNEIEEYFFNKGILNSDVEKTNKIVHILRDAIIKPYKYIAPVSTLNSVVSSVEMGSSSTPSFTVGYVKNDGGEAIGYGLEKNGELVSNWNQGESIHLQNITSSIYFKGIANHSQGGVGLNNLHEPTLEGIIEAGYVKSTARTITPRFKMFFGAVDSVPVSSEDVRGLVGSQFNNAYKILLQTTYTKKTFIVAIPSNMVISTAEDKTNMGVNLFDKYVLTKVIKVELPNGETSDYNIYVMTVSKLYGKNSVHEIVTKIN